MFTKNKFLFSTTCVQDLHLPLDVLKESFIETLVWSALTDINIVVLKNCKVYNIEYTNVQLIDSPQWRYHYFIPTQKFNENIIFLGYINELDNYSFIKEVLKPEIISYDIEQSIDLLCRELQSTDIDYNHHSLKTINDEYFANYYDLICFGLNDWLPSHWGEDRKYKDFSVDLYEIYSDFLEKNHYNDSIEVSILFYNQTLKNKKLQ